MKRSIESSTALLALLIGVAALSGGADAQAPGLNTIETVVVIYAENRSFDNLYGNFPGANGLQNVTPENSTQVDRDGTPLKELPPVWDKLTAKGVTPAVTQAQTEHLPNKPFAIDDPNGFNTKLGVVTHETSQCAVMKEALRLATVRGWIRDAGLNWKLRLAGLKRMICSQDAEVVRPQRTWPGIHANRKRTGRGRRRLACRYISEPKRFFVLDRTRISRRAGSKIRSGDGIRIHANPLVRWNQPCLAKGRASLIGAATDGQRNIVLEGWAGLQYRHIIRLRFVPDGCRASLLVQQCLNSCVGVQRFVRRLGPAHSVLQPTDDVRQLIQRHRGRPDRRIFHAAQRTPDKLQIPESIRLQRRRIQMARQIHFALHIPHRSNLHAHTTRRWTWQFAGGERAQCREQQARGKQRRNVRDVKVT